MTRSVRTSASVPVVSGKSIKWTLEQREAEEGVRVHVDWLRFTVPLDAVVACGRDLNPDLTWMHTASKEDRERAIAIVVSDAGEVYDAAPAVAKAGADHIVSILTGLTVGLVEESGMDFYRARAALVREGQTVGYVLAGSRKAQQASTVHVNLFGEAMLHVSHAQLRTLRDWLGTAKGWITRADLAFDIWDGFQISEVPDRYLDGAFDVRGKRPKQEEAGSWSSGYGRTFYVGSRDTGKLLRIYEKGDQLFGPEQMSPWVRAEIEFRNNHRVIDLDVLSRPADFFCGSYDYCAELLTRFGVSAEPEVIRTLNPAKDATAHAACTRMVAWCFNTVAPAVAKVLEYGGDLLGLMLEQNEWRMPKRLRGWTTLEIRDAMDKVAAALAPASAPSINGAV